MAEEEEKEYCKNACHTCHHNRIPGSEHLRAGRTSRLDMPKESVSTSSECLNKNGSLRRVSERFTQPFDSGIQTVIEVDERIHGPELGTQLIASNKFPWSLEQRSQHLKGLLLKSYFVSPLAQFSGLQVHFERTEPDDSG